MWRDAYKLSEAAEQAGIKVRSVESGGLTGGSAVVGGHCIHRGITMRVEVEMSPVAQAEVRVVGAHAGLRRRVEASAIEDVENLDADSIRAAVAKAGDWVYARLSALLDHASED